MKKFFKIPGLVVCDLFLCAFTTLFSAVLIFEFNFKAAFTYLTLNTAYLFIWPTVIIFNLIFDCYSNLWRRSGLLDLLRLVGSNACAATIWGILKLFDVVNFSGSIIVLFFILNFMFSAAARLLPRFLQIISSRSVTRAAANRTVIVGSGETGTYLAQYFITNPEKGYLPVAFIDNDPQLKDALICGVKVAGGDNQLPAIIEKFDVHTVMVALPSASREDLRRIYGLVRNTDAALKIYSGVQDYTDKLNANLRNIRIEDLLGRDPVKMKNGEAKAMLSDATVLVTGGAGSIGSELCRQILAAGARRLIVYDFSENGLFYIGNELSERFGNSRFITILGSIRDKSRLKAVFDEYKPQLVFHAAAHKHVPMMEINPLEAVKNNIFGTRNVLAQCIDSGVKKCVLISSDKAVNPSNVMGATKRISELQFMDFNRQNKTEFCAVRFGNVLGSEGSVVPFFAKQIESGGPVTVTDPEIRRYFMTIPEAVSLVL
ncbi:MAG TPA: nucleoside-diphosphate sugar epimerase/dehydratase, partial [Clostridiales bacterium]|nr:nucleoside-diphosphate sugar epimerase/dehydratase [Clostridiales bacterium]